MSINRFEFNDRKHASIIVELLYKSRDRTADVHFVYHGPSGGTVRIPAHRNVLGMGSTILYDLFFGPHKITGDIPTKSTTVTAQTFESFISLLYGKWDSINKDNYIDLLCVSQNIDAPFCVEACNAFIKQLDEEDSEADR